MPQNYYDILGVSKSASQDEIKAAFRRLAMEHHPDKGGDSEKFKKINEAYQVLGEQKARTQYDQYGSTFEDMRRQGYQGFGFDPREMGINFDFNDISDLFGGLGDIFGFGGATRQRQKKSAGRDLELNTEITLDECVKGAQREIELEKLGLCTHCSGGGAEPGTKIISCTTCGGRGQVAQMVRSFFGNIQTVITCAACHGEGKKAEKACGSCHGKGSALIKKRLTVKIPAGISDGETIRLTGEGEELGRGGRAGNLYLNIRVKPHKIFERRENDIWSKAPLDFKLAALGGKIEVETVDGPVDLKIPAGTPSGQVFKLKNKGIPYLHGGGCGDQYVEVYIKVPERLTRKQKEFLENWED